MVNFDTFLRFVPTPTDLRRDPEPDTADELNALCVAIAKRLVLPDLRPQWRDDVEPLLVYRQFNPANDKWWPISVLGLARPNQPEHIVVPATGHVIVEPHGVFYYE